MTLEELEKKYAKIPLEIKQTRRWIGYKIENRDGRDTKVPYNAISGDKARSNDPTTWTTFRVALLGSIKYGFNGIGFMLGEDKNNGTRYFGVDLDNHELPDGTKPMSVKEFEEFTNRIVHTLNSYAEYSHSGEGVHIICKGTLPEGRRKSQQVEMYDKGRFFTMTGKTILNVPIQDRTEEVKPIWEEFLKREEDDIVEVDVSKKTGGVYFGDMVRERIVTISSKSHMSDSEVIDKIMSSTNSTAFNQLYNGNMSAYQDDHSRADMALCQILAFWTGNDKDQIDRIFRSSGLMRQKWDSYRGDMTYGEQTIEVAIKRQRETYTPKNETVIVRTEESVSVPRPNKESNVIEPTTEMVMFDNLGDPIIKAKRVINKHYALDDTGNAERFYDYFGDYFKYNKTDKGFMFWNGKTWTVDIKDFVRKYANKIIGVLKGEIKDTQREIEEAEKNDLGTDELKSLLKQQELNMKRVSNKAGKDAMLAELQSLHTIPLENYELDIQEELLNTDSGVVDLRTGEVKPHDRLLKLSKNTNCKVSFEEPTVFMKFLRDIFWRNNEEETQELIDFVQLALGDSLFGRNNKDKLYILYGNGSNGKSTFINVITRIFGDYGTTMNSDLLIAKNNNASQSVEFSLSALTGKRFVSTSETAEGKKMDTVAMKQMLSGEQISVQKKFGNQFNMTPKFSPWMSTNNKPVIRDTDYGTWRRIYLIPFINKFDDSKKDVNMPKKLANEMPQILGWMIQGAVKIYNNNFQLAKPKCLEEALVEYKTELDTIQVFLTDMCIMFPGKTISTQTLFEKYKNWAKQNEEFMYSESRFRTEMVKRGFNLIKDLNNGLMYSGLKLIEDKRGVVFGEVEEVKQ